MMSAIGLAPAAFQFQYTRKLASYLAAAGSGIAVLSECNT